MKKSLIFLFASLMLIHGSNNATNITPTISGDNISVTKINNVYYAPISSINSISNIVFDPKGQTSAGYSSGRQMWMKTTDGTYIDWLKFTLSDVYVSNGGSAVKSITIQGNKFDYPVQILTSGNRSNCIKCPDWNTQTLFSYGPLLKISTAYYPYKVTTSADVNNTAGLITDIASDTYLQFYTPDNDTVCTAPNNLISFAFGGYKSFAGWEYSTDNGLSWLPIANTLPYYYEQSPKEGLYLYRAYVNSFIYTDIKHVLYVDSVKLNSNIISNKTALVTGDSLGLSVPFSQNYQYQWYKGNSIIDNATYNSYVISHVRTYDAGSYSCKISNLCNNITMAAINIAINKAAQTIIFPDIPLKTFGDSPFSLPLTTDKGVEIFYQSTNTAVATISGNTVTIVAPGTTNIIASQGGTGDYLAATGVTKTLTVNKIAQTISLASTSTKTFGDAAFTLPANTDKSKTITYSSSNTAVATISGNTVTIIGAGTTDITAIQAGDTYFYAAPTVTQTLTVNKANQTITFDAFATKTYGDAVINLPTTSSAGLTISYSSNNPAVVSVSGNTLTINKAGTATITATQSGNTNCAAASSVSQDITVQKANQTIIWSNIPNKTYGDASFTLPATTDKNLTIAYQSADTTIAKVSGNTVTIKGAGTVNITATQSGSENYNAASSITLPLSISKAAQTITFADLPAYTYSASPVTLSASSNSGVAVTYDSSDPNVASVSGNTLTINNTGTCYITASVVGNSNYLTGTPVQKLVTVNKANQTVTFDAISNKTYGDAGFNLTASANTGLPVTFTSGTPAKLIISGTTATIAGAGSYTVTATQAGNSNYNSATATRTFTVNKAALIATADSKTRLYGDANPTFTTTYSGFVNGDSKAELAAIPVAISTATATSTVGTYDITLSTITDVNYTLTYRKGTLTVNKASLTVTANNATKVYGEANPTFGVSYSGFKNSETSNVLLSLPVVTTVAKTMSNVGIYDLISSAGSASNYDLNYINGQFNILKAPLSISVKKDSIYKGAPIPIFTLIYNGFKGTDNSTVLDVLPTITCSATNTNSIGSFPVILQGGSDNNYNYSLNNGILYIKDNTGVENVYDNITIYPNPTTGKLIFNAEFDIRKIEVFSLDGVMLNNFIGDQLSIIDISNLSVGVYYVKLYGIKTSVSRLIIKK